jgi:AcrR family transcriptional regulator
MSEDPFIHDQPLNHRTLTGRKRRAATETKIVRAAVRIFSERGPDAVVIDDFVKAAGVSRGTFYNYFKTTEELLSAAVEERLNEINSLIEAHVATTDDPLRRCAFILRSYLERAMRDPAWGAFLAQIPKIGAAAQAGLLKDLQQGKRQGLLSFDRTDAAVDMVIGTMMQSFRRISSQPVPPDYPRAVIHGIMRGLGAAENRIVEAICEAPEDKLLQQIPPIASS